MKTLNERATKILKALLAVRAYRIGHGNGVYTRLRAAMIERNGKYNLISLVEYYEAKGKLAQNTEMNFAFDTSTKQFIPYYYCNKLSALNRIVRTRQKTEWRIAPRKDRLTTQILQTDG